MSTDRYIPQPAPRADDDAFLPLRLLACLLAGITVAKALLVALTTDSDVWPSGSEGMAGAVEAGLVAVLSLPLLLMLWGFVATAAWYLLRRDLPCIVAILVSLTWLAFGS